MRFGVLVLTLNEEKHIAGCLSSLSSAERIVVLDSGSTDHTREVAARFENVKVAVRAFTDFADQRNFGVRESFSPGEWVLHLDADERLTPGLAREIAGLEPGPAAVAYNVASLVFLDGKAIPRASSFPVYQTRLTRTGAFEFARFGHGQKAPEGLGTLPRLSAPYEHHPFEKGFEEWRTRHERYAVDEAEELSFRGRRAPGWDTLRDPIRRRSWLNQMLGASAVRPWLVWSYLMFIRLGLIEGPAGWEYCRRRRLYEGMLRDRLRERRRQRATDQEHGGAT
jgi:glycosyltransferase involved in cell wall biosynthesis